MPVERSTAVGGYVAPLDGIRAVAAVMVVLFHAQVGFVSGDLGVDIFFVLSGFLITGILLRSGGDGHMSYRRFYVRRALRLLPAYFAVLAFSVVADFVWNSGGTLKGAVFSLAYVSNWAAGQEIGLGLLAHTWSLSIEEQFYLVWPLLLMWLIRRAGSRADRLVVSVAVLVALTLVATVLCWVLGLSVGFTWNSTFCRGSQLLAGALLAVWVTARHAEGHHAVPGSAAVGTTGLLSLLGLVAVSWMSWEDPWVTILVRWPLVTILTVALIVCCISPSRQLVNRMLGSRPMVATGRVSYGLYLWHFPVLVLVDSTLGLNTWGPRLLGLAITAVIVPMSYRYIERPFLALKTEPGTPLGRALRLAPESARVRA
ncbi:acyltransferase family protein [Nocardioides sp. GCM10028917]|uniref:acyltransferase family protein n=1 Tax=Nocardioides sp. GCM10028917 TaxID=3273408 RepID=UPI00361175E1